MPNGGRLTISATRARRRRRSRRARPGDCTSACRSATTGAECRARRSAGRSSPSIRPRKSAAARGSACRWSTALRPSSAAASRLLASPAGDAGRPLSARRQPAAPRSRRPRSAPSARPAAAVGAAGRRRGLVRFATAEMIRELGHQVTEAGSGAEALEHLPTGSRSTSSSPTTRCRAWTAPSSPGGSAELSGPAGPDHHRLHRLSDDGSTCRAWRSRSGGPRSAPRSPGCSPLTRRSSASRPATDSPNPNV